MKQILVIGFAIGLMVAPLFFFIQITETLARGLLFTFSLLAIGVGIPFLMTAMKVPISSFFNASKKNSILLMHPNERRKMELDVGKGFGALTLSKDGFYDVNPDHVYLERYSKCPTALIYGTMGASINPKIAATVPELKKLGITNYDELERYNKDHPGSEIKIPIVGVSVPMHEILAYFNRNDRSDLMEAEHEWKMAEREMSKFGSENKWIKVVIAISVLLVCAGIAVAIINSFATSNNAATSSADAGLIKQLSEQLTQNAAVKTLNGTSVT